MTTVKLVTLLVLALCLPGSSIAAEVNEDLVEVVVIGRQPGPPLWKVSNGDKVLWVFPYLRWIPKNMIWESGRVERIIAESQEILGLPKISWGPSPGFFNKRRYRRLLMQLEQNPDGGTLEESLPPELYTRFAALQARYFPANHDFDGKRPLEAGRRMMRFILKQEGLDSSDDILKKIRRFVHRNRDIEHTEIFVRTEIDSFDELKDRVEAVYGSLPPEQERACFEQQVRHMEEDIAEMRSRAYTWAQGNIDKFRNVPLWEFNESDACNGLFFGSTSPEQETLIGMTTRMNQAWLDAAEDALATNTSTFAILPITELVAEDGLLSRLKAKGYEVREP